MPPSPLERKHSFKDRILTCVAGFGAALVLGVVIFSVAKSRGEENAAPLPDPAAFQKEKERVYATIVPDDEAGFVRKPSPKAGEWLATYNEPPQALEKYKQQAKVKPTKDRRTIVLQPLGAFNDEQKKVLEAMKDYAEAFFQLPARIEEPMAFPPKGMEEDDALVRMIPIGHRRAGYDRQYNADTILEKVLKKNLPKDAVVYLGITMQDLYVEQLNYVFGLGSFDKRVGVYSLVRYFPEFWGNERKDGDDVLALTRACKVLNHETGHMFGLKHCIFYKCSMNGSNSLAETDAEPLHYCPVCHRKLMWGLELDTVKCYEDLGAFYAQHGMKEEAAWTKDRLERWKKVLATEAAKKDE
ncbi:MAG: hypothetical protein HY291_21460 [Planctomycetes bacterium]|nr:hypothetical protein [Planctomycetota bacterium]